MGAPEFLSDTTFKLSVDKIFQMYLYNPAGIKEHLKGKMDVVFSSGDVVSTTGRTTFVSLPFWRLLHENGMPIKMQHHAQMYMGNGYFKSSVVKTLATRVLFDIIETCRNSWVMRAEAEGKFVNPEEVVRWKIIELSKRLLECYDEFYNASTDISSEYMTAIRMTDFIESYLLPEIFSQREAIEDNEPSIRAFDEVFQKHMATDPRLDNNMLAFFMRCGAVKAMQIGQIQGSRGYNTDIGSGLFRYPTKDNYFNGLNNIAYLAYESRSPAKSHLFAEAPLEDGAFFSRRQQLAAGFFKTVHMGDCGTKEYLPWKIHASDIYFLTGSYYLDPFTQKLELFTDRCKHLIGETVMFRSVLAGCVHPDPNGVCEKCFGHNGMVISPYASAGIAYVQRLARILIQLMLSVKHYDGTANTKPVDLPYNLEEYLWVSENTKIHLSHEKLRNCDVSLIIKSANITVLQAIASLDLDGYDSRLLNQLSLLNKSIKLEVRHMDGSEVEECASFTLKFNGAYASCSIEFLKYIQQYGYEQTNLREIRIKLNHWDYNKPIAALPHQHFTMTHFQRDFANELENSHSKIKDALYTSPSALLKLLYAKIVSLNDKNFKANMSTLSAFIYPLSAQDPASGDYRLPKGSPGYVLPLTRAFDMYRSATGILAYQQLADALKQPEFWDGSMENMAHKPLSHTMDSMFMY